MAISLASLQTGRPNAPFRMVLAGTPGVGKTSFACSAPAPVVLQTEDGVDALIDAGLLPESLARFPKATTYAEILEALFAVYSEEHAFQTLVLDSLDWLEPVIHVETCRVQGADSIEKVGGGWAKGYVEALTQWREVFTALNAIRETRKMNIILVAHSAVRRVEFPDSPPFDRYELKLNKHAHKLVEEWADIVALAQFKVLFSTRTEGAGKAEKKITKAVGGADRVLYTSERPSAVAKNRYGLPPELPLEWAAFETALRR